MIDFNLYDAQGNLFKLCDNVPLVLYFYPKDSTKGCTIEAIDFSNNITNFYKLGYKVIGISKDDDKAHKKFINNNNLKINLLSDTNNDVCNLFNVIKEKNMYGRKYLGIERSTFIINNKCEIIKEWRNVKVPNHVKEVLKFLQSL